MYVAVKNTTNLNVGSFINSQTNNYLSFAPNQIQNNCTSIYSLANGMQMNNENADRLKLIVIVLFLIKVPMKQNFLLHYEKELLKL